MFEQDVLDRVKAYMEAHIVGQVHAFEEAARFPLHFWQELVATYRVFDLLLAEDEEKGLRTFIELIRLLSREFSSLASIIAVQGLYGIWLLKYFGTSAQKREFLPQWVSGQAMVALAFYEEGRPLGIKLPETIAHQTTSGWVLSGQKSMVSNSALASQIIVFAQTVTLTGEKGTGLFLVDKAAPGVVLGEPIVKSGLRALPLAPMYFEQVHLDDAAVLTTRQSGLEQCQYILTKMRLAISAQSIGIAEGVFHKGLAESRVKRGFGKRLIDATVNQYKFAELAAQIASCESFYIQYLASDLTSSRQVSLLKLITSRLVKDVSEEILRITGDYSFITDHDLERYVRDAEILSFYGGKSENLKRAIAEVWL